MPRCVPPSAPWAGLPADSARSQPAWGTYSTTEALLQAIRPSSATAALLPQLSICPQETTSALTALRGPAANVRGHRRLADLTRAAPPSRRRARCAWSWGVHASRSGGHRDGALPGARRSPGQARRPAAHACTLEGPARLPAGYKQRSCMHCRTNWHPAQFLARQADERRALAACQAAPLFRARRMGPLKSMRQLPCRQPEAGRIWPAPTATARIALRNWHACGRSNLQYNTD